MRAMAGLLAVAALSGCVLDDIGGVNRKAVFNAVSPDELVALGAVRLIGDDITTELSGRTFIEPNENWIWEIGADGSQAARAADGEWADAPGGQWQVTDDRFCRENEDLALKCSEVFKLGAYFRFTEPDGTLAVWTITEG